MHKAGVVIALGVITLGLLSACRGPEKEVDEGKTRSDSRDVPAQVPPTAPPQNFSTVFALLALSPREWESGDLDSLLSAIKSADPTEFNSVWSKLGELRDSEHKRNLQGAAIFHLAAEKDLRKAGELVNERFGPGRDRIEVLEQCLFLSEPAPSEALGFFRNLELANEKTALSSLCAFKIAVSGRLGELAIEGLRLAVGESRALAEALADLAHQQFYRRDSGRTTLEGLEGFADEIEGLVQVGVLRDDALMQFLLAAGVRDSSNLPDLIGGTEQLGALLTYDSSGRITIMPIIRRRNVAR